MMGASIDDAKDQLYYAFAVPQDSEIMEDEEAVVIKGVKLSKKE